MKTYRIAQLIALLVSVALLYLNWTRLNNPVVGIVGLGLYYGMSAIWFGCVIRRIVPVSQAWSLLFGFLTGFYSSAMAVGIPVVVWRYDRIAVAAALLITALVGYALALVIKQKEARPTKAWLLVCKGILADKYVWAFASCAAVFVFFMQHARTGVYILSPWDALSSFVLMVFFVMAFIVARLLFSGRPTLLVLGVIVIFSYLTHLYLPAVYETGFGGDKWRHLGAEQWLQEGNVYTPSIWGQEAPMVRFGPISVPEALVAGNKTSYAAQWSVTIFLAESLGVSLFWVDLLLVFLLWSLFLPAILFQFGRAVFKEDRLGLLFAFLPTLFYTFQSEGAVTIPVSFGHLFFFFVFWLWMYYVQSGNRNTAKAALVFSLLFYWGYILNFFMLIGIGMLSIVYRKRFVSRTHWERLREKYHISTRRLKLRDAVFFGFLVAISVLVIPFLELFQGLSAYLPGSLSPSGLLDAFADAFGRLSGFIGIIVPPDFIDQGNFLYNQTKESLSRLPLFSYRAVPFIISMIVWIVVAWSIYRLYRYHRMYKIVVLISIIFLIVLGSYFVSWSFTEGVHVLARRLNETIVFLMILFLGWGIWLFLQSGSPSFAKEGSKGWLARIPYRKRILATVFFLAFAATSTYASGPKLQLVTADELAAAKLVWQEHQHDAEPYCVIANTWPLLGLEAVSGRKITAGNFPVYQEYAQPERVKIFEGMSKAPSRTWIAGAFRVTGADVCYYMTENRWINDQVLEQTIELLGEPKRAGDVYIWRIER